VLLQSRDLGSDFVPIEVRHLALGLSIVYKIPDLQQAEEEMLAFECSGAKLDGFHSRQSQEDTSGW
jgi:hypothetical protein